MNTCWFVSKQYTHTQRHASRARRVHIRYTGTHTHHTILKITPAPRVRSATELGRRASWLAREAGQVRAPPCSAQLAVAAAASRDEAAARAMSVKARLISMSSSFLSSSLLTKTCSLAEPSKSKKRGVYREIDCPYLIDDPSQNDARVDPVPMVLLRETIKQHLLVINS